MLLCSFYLYGILAVLQSTMYCVGMWRDHHLIGVSCCWTLSVVALLSACPVPFASSRFLLLLVLFPLDLQVRIPYEASRTCQVGFVQGRLLYPAPHCLLVLGRVFLLLFRGRPSHTHYLPWYSTCPYVLCTMILFVLIRPRADVLGPSNVVCPSSKPAFSFRGSRVSLLA